MPDIDRDENIKQAPNINYFFDPDPKRTRSTVWQWFRLALTATLNVLILGAFAAYFNNQSLSLIEVIGIIADSMGIILGLLGIWFFFLSERLNRTTALNLERTTTTVDDLRTQMWQMINKTFDTFLGGGEQDIEEAKQQLEEIIQKVKEGEGDKNSSMIRSIEALNKRLSSIENKQENLSSIKPITSMHFATSNPEAGNFVLALRTLAKHIDGFPMTKSDLVSLLLNENQLNTAFSRQFLHTLMSNQALVLKEGNLYLGESMKDLLLHWSLFFD